MADFPCDRNIIICNFYICIIIINSGTQLLYSALFGGVSVWYLVIEITKIKTTIQLCICCLSYLSKITGIHTEFSVGGGGRGKREHQPVVLSQMLLCVVKMRSFVIKCIDETTKRLSCERMMLYITKSWQHVKILGGELRLGGISQVSPPPVWIPEIGSSTSRLLM